MGLPPVIHFNRSFSTSAYCSTLLSGAKLQEFASKRTFHLELHEIAETFDAFGGDRLGIWRLKVRTLERAWRQSSYQDDTAVLVLAQGFASCTCRLPPDPERMGRLLVYPPSSWQWIGEHRTDGAHLQSSASAAALALRGLHRCWCELCFCWNQKQHCNTQLWYVDGYQIRWALCRHRFGCCSEASNIHVHAAARHSQLFGKDFLYR